jgi:hypothetical protein
MYALMGITGLKCGAAVLKRYKKSFKALYFKALEPPLPNATQHFQSTKALKK